MVVNGSFLYLSWDLLVWSPLIWPRKVRDANNAEFRVLPMEIELHTYYRKPILSEMTGCILSFDAVEPLIPVFESLRPDQPNTSSPTLLVFMLLTTLVLRTEALDLSAGFLDRLPPFI